MIVHHEQAVLMSSYVESRTNNKTILDLAKRIDVSQVDEINFMESWLKARNEVVSINHMNHGNDMHVNMAGMASKQQLEKLRDSNGTSFDRLFLSLMIAHHDGALEMVKELRSFLAPPTILS